jgi:hypothetical protein
MSLALRISIVSAFATAIAVGFAGLDDLRAADYPTPRPLAKRQAEPSPSDIHPVAPLDAPPPVAPVAEESTPRRPRVVRVDVQSPIATAEPRELPPLNLAMPTPRAIARRQTDDGKSAPAMQASPARAASHESDIPGEKPANTDGSILNVVPRDGITSSPMPWILVPSRGSPPSNGPYATKLTAAVMQPPTAHSYIPTAEDLDRWFTPLNKLGIQSQPEQGDFPRDYSGKLFAIESKPRRKDWPEREFNWEAPEVWHQPFYFEDVPLERYGQSLCPERQAWLSGLKFYMTFPLLPIKLWADPPFSKVATFGYYRVGSDNPAVRQKSILPYGYGPEGGGYARGAGSFWEVPPLPAWETTPQ